MKYTVKKRPVTPAEIGEMSQRPYFQTKEGERELDSLERKGYGFVVLGRAGQEITVPMDERGAEEFATRMNRFMGPV